MTGYVRQSVADIVPAAVVRAAPINNELNALRDAFGQAAGHKHDGTAAEGHYVPLIADSDANNKVAIDTANNRAGVFVEVGGTAVEQVRVQDGAIVPVTDNDIDLGTSSLEFKDLYIDGTANIDSLIADTADINAGTIDNTIIGATTAAAATVTSLTSTGTTTLNGTTIPASKTLVVTTDKLSALAATTSSELAGVISDETGSGALVFANSPTLVSPALGTPSSGTVTNLTGTASININGTVGATTPSTGAFTTLSSTGNTTLGDASADTVTINGTVQPGVVISGSSTGNALRITQTGTGNALVVEDSSNPDSTPFVIDPSGLVLNGSTTKVNADDASGVDRTTWSYQANSTQVSGAGYLASYWADNTQGAGGLSIAKSRGAAVGTRAIVQNGDELGKIGFVGDDGTNFISAVGIFAQVDGTPGTNDMPGRLVFSTTADGASSPTERLRITNAGNVGVGVTAPATKLDVLGTIQAAAAATQDAVQIAGRAGGTGSFAATITTDTLAASVTHTLPAITGTLATLANTSQTFTGSTSIIPATNSANITIGAIPQTGTITVDRSQATHTLDIGVGPTLSGNTKTINFGTAGASGSTTNINIGSAVSGAATYTTVTGSFKVNGVDVGLGAGLLSPNAVLGASALQSAITGINNVAVGNAALGNSDASNNTAVGSDSMTNLTTGTDNVAVGFLTMNDASTGSGNIAVGASAMSGTVVTGDFNIAIGSGAGASITSGQYNNFIGASSGNTVTTGSNNVILGNYDGLSGPISQTGSNWIVFSDGDGNVRQSFDPSGNSQMGSGAAVVYCPTPSTITGTATLTNADIRAQIINTTGAALYTVTLPLGTDLETLIPWSSVDLGYDFYIINSVPANITIGTNTGVTLVGRNLVATNISGQFRIRRTAANTFIVYRIN